MDLEQAKEKFKEVFDGIDTEGNGQISAGELKNALVSAGFKDCTDEQAQELVAAADTSGSGTIGFEEFCTAIISLGIKIRVAMVLTKAFESIDTDGTGVISKDNLKDLVVKLKIQDKMGEGKIDELIAAADTSGEGTINFEEFVGLVGAALEEAQ